MILSQDNFPQTFIKNEIYGINTMCEGYEISEKEEILNKKYYLFIINFSVFEVLMYYLGYGEKSS